MGDLIDEIEIDEPAEQYVLSGGEAKFIRDLVRRLNISPSVLAIGFDDTHDKMMGDYAFMDIPELMASVPWEISAQARDNIIENKHDCLLIGLANELVNLEEVLKTNVLSLDRIKFDIPEEVQRIERRAHIERMIPKGFVGPTETVRRSLERAYEAIDQIRHHYIFIEMSELVSLVAAHKRFTHLRVCLYRDNAFAPLAEHGYVMSEWPNAHESNFYHQWHLLGDTSSLVRCILQNLRSATGSITYSIVNEDEIEEDEQLVQDDGIRDIQANEQPGRARFNFEHLEQFDTMPNLGITHLEQSDDIITRLFYRISCGITFNSLHACSLYILPILIRELQRMRSHLCQVQNNLPKPEEELEIDPVEDGENVQVEQPAELPRLPPYELGHDDLTLSFVDPLFTPYQLECLLEADCFQDLTHLELCTTLRIDQLAPQLILLTKLDTFIWTNGQGRNESICLTTDHPQSPLIKWWLIPELNSVRTLILNDSRTNQHTRMEQLCNVFPKLHKLALRPYTSGTIIGTRLYIDLLKCRQLVHLHVCRKGAGELIIPELGSAFHREELMDLVEMVRAHPKEWPVVLWIGFPLEEELIMDRNHIMIQGAHNHRNLITFAQNDRDVIELLQGDRAWSDDLLAHFYYI